MAKQKPKRGALTRKTTQGFETFTIKQELFCQQYVIDNNATRAAIAAGYSEDSASAIGSENLGKPEVRARIDELVKTRLAAAAVTGERVIQELARLAFGDTRGIVRFEKGKMIITDTDKLTPEQASMIAGMSQKSGNTVEKKIEFHSKTEALRMLGQALKLYTEKVDVNNTGAVLVKLVDDIPDTLPPSPAPPTPAAAVTVQEEKPAPTRLDTPAGDVPAG